MKPPPFIQEGTIIHGTLRNEDVLRALADELERVVPATSTLLVRDARLCADHLELATYGSEEATDAMDEADGILTELFDRLDANAPAGMYFGAHPGDGSDFGWWAVEEAS